MLENVVFDKALTVTYILYKYDKSGIELILFEIAII